MRCFPSDLSSTVVFCLICSICLVAGRPAEEPTRFTLRTTKDSKSDASIDVSTPLRQGKQLIASEARSVAATIRQPRLSLEGGQDEPRYDASTPLRVRARLDSEEQQGLLERPLSIAQKSLGGVLEGILMPTPIVDGLKEENKYGNNGDKFMGISRALVNGFEGLSNFLNSVIDLPKNAAQRTSKGFTDALNQIGARIIGLQ